MKKLMLSLCIILCIGLIPSSVLASTGNIKNDAKMTEETSTEVTAGTDSTEKSEEATEVTVATEKDVIESESKDTKADSNKLKEQKNASMDYDDIYAAMKKLKDRADALDNVEDAEKLWDELMDLWEQIYAAQENGLFKLSDDEKGKLDTLTDEIYACLVELGYDSYGLMPLDDVNSYEEFKAAINGKTGTIDITLNDSFSTEGTEHIKLESGAEVTIDLNGYTIQADDTGGGALFTIPDGATLTIRDSKESTATKGNVTSVIATDAGQLANITGNVENGIALTYYVTESVVKNALTGATQETRYRYSVNSSGMICTTGQNHALFSVEDGTLNIKGGFIYGESVSSGNRAINASSGTVNISGGYICGFNEAYNNGHSEAYDGGAVRATGSAVVNISEDAVIAANKAATGGAVDIANGSTLNMSGGIISGNEATEEAGTSEWNNDYGGGGIHAYGLETSVNISGGYLTNNVSDCTGYFDGGGGILLNGATLKFNGGYITGNKAGSSGGGIRTAFAAYGGQMPSSVHISGGYLCANYAKSAEGGGLCLDNGSYSEIKSENSIYINNNKTDTSVHWGGGGMFCANNATMYMSNTLITENEAGGFGGGVAGCSTGRIAIADDAGAAIYNNTASGEHTSGDGSEKHDDTDYALKDKVFLESGYQDYYCALESMVSGRMLGGGSANWQGSADGVAIEKGSVGINDYLWATYIMGLTANPTNSDISLAQKDASIYVTGNSSYTHGGGVLSNGYLFLGSIRNYEIGDALQINADKRLEDQNGEYEDVKEDQFTFEITDEDGKVAATGSTQSDGGIFFDKRLPFDKVGEFTYYIKEVPTKDSSIIIDQSVYTLVVTVEEDDEEVEIDGETIDFTYYHITHVTLTKSGDTVLLVDEDINSGIDGVASITIPSPAFTNYDMEEITITVNKTWEGLDGTEKDWPDDMDDITIGLYQNGVLYGDKVTLNESDFPYVWKALPTHGVEKGGEIVSYVYEVREDHVSGYMPSYEVTTDAGEVEDSYWVPFSETDETKLMLGQQYLIVSADGNTALNLTEGHINDQLTTSDTARISSSEEPLELGEKTYKTWYANDDNIQEAMIWIPTTNSDRTILKNVQYTQSSLLVQGGTGNYSGLKGCNDDNYASAMKVDEDGYLMGQFEWNADNGWRYIVYADGRFNAINSETVPNDAVKLYVKITPLTEDTTVGISNKYMGYKEVSGLKTWKDGNDADGIRPDSITINLFADGEQIDSMAVTAEEKWKWSFIDLPEYRMDDDGKLIEIEYTIQEENVEGYTAQYDDDGYNITNKHNPGKPTKSTTTAGTDKQKVATTPVADDTASTGDDSNLMIWLLILITAVLICITLIVIEIRKRRS